MPRLPHAPARVAVAIALVASGVALGVAAAPPAAASCEEGHRSIHGTVSGEDGRFVSAQVSFVMFDAERRLIGMDGCERGDGYAATTLVNAKPGSRCCFILPGSGSESSPHHDGIQSYDLATTWSLTDIPDNVVEIWIETYTKRAGGQPNSSTERYGHSVRRVQLPEPDDRPEPPTTTSTTTTTTTTTTPAAADTTVPGETSTSTTSTSTTTTPTTTSTTPTTTNEPTRQPDPIHIVQPLRCGLEAGDTEGSTGAITGRVFVDGVQVTPARVSAFSTNPDPGNGGDILGFGVSIDHPPGAYRLEALPPGDYAIFVTAGGTTRRFDGLRVTACDESTTDVAVSGALPRAGGVVVGGDWDGDGDDEPASFLAGRWHLRSEAATEGLIETSFAYGAQPGDIPVAGDWDGDGDDEPGIYRRGTWHLRTDATSTGTTARQLTYGLQAGDIPVAGDWDGDGDGEPGIYRRGTWHLRTDATSTGTTARQLTYGLQAGDTPVAGDWDGDGDDEPGIYRRGTWHLRTDVTATGTTGTTAHRLSYGTRPGDTPVAGNWDGDAPDEPGIDRSGELHLRGSSGAQSTIATYRYPM